MIFEGYWRIMFRQISVWGSTRRRNYMATVAGGRRPEPNAQPVALRIRVQGGRSRPELFSSEKKSVLA
jgi:hypothetical protein